MSEQPRRSADLRDLWPGIVLTIDLPALRWHMHDLDAGPCDCDEPPKDWKRWCTAFEKVSEEEQT